MVDITLKIYINQLRLIFIISFQEIKTYLCLSRDFFLVIKHKYLLIQASNAQLTSPVYWNKYELIGVTKILSPISIWYSSKKTKRDRSEIQFVKRSQNHKSHSNKITPRWKSRIYNQWWGAPQEPISFCHEK